MTISRILKTAAVGLVSNIGTTLLTSKSALVACQNVLDNTHTKESVMKDILGPVAAGMMATTLPAFGMTVVNQIVVHPFLKSPLLESAVAGGAIYQFYPKILQQLGFKSSVIANTFEHGKNFGSSIGKAASSVLKGDDSKAKGDILNGFFKAGVVAESHRIASNEKVSITYDENKTLNIGVGDIAKISTWGQFNVIDYIWSSDVEPGHSDL